MHIFSCVFPIGLFYRLRLHHNLLLDPCSPYIPAGLGPFRESEPPGRRREDPRLPQRVILREEGGRLLATRALPWSRLRLVSTSIPDYITRLYECCSDWHRLEIVSFPWIGKSWIRACSLFWVIFLHG